MDLKSITTVRTIAECGSFQKAANQLNYAQSTITFQVRQLEEELGVKLFERQGRAMRLTKQGEALMPHFDRVANAAAQLKEEARAEGGDLRGELVISLPESLVTYKMQPVLAAFKHAAPNVRLTLHVENCYTIYDKLLLGQTDIALHYDIADYPPYIEAKSLATYPLVLVGSPSLAESERNFTTPGVRKRMCHIRNDPHALYLHIWEAYLADRRITLEPDLEVWSIESVKRCAESGLGVAYLPRFTVEEELRGGSLVELPTGIEHGEMTAIVVHDTRRWKSPAARLFLKLVNEHFKR